MTLFRRRMFNSMKPKHILFVLVIALAAVLLSGCTGQAGLNNSWPGLASDGENAYLASGQYVYAIRLSDGREVWRYPDSGSNSLQFIAQPVVAPDGTIVIGSAGSDHRLVALDPSSLSGDTVKTPAEKWVFSEAKSSWVAGILVLNDKVFAPNSDGILYVLDLQDGLSSKPALQKINLGGALWARPSTDGNLVYVATVDHHLYAIDPETYEFAWPAIDLGGAAPGTPLVGFRCAPTPLVRGSWAGPVLLAALRLRDVERPPRSRRRPELAGALLVRRRGALRRVCDGDAGETALCGCRPRPGPGRRRADSPSVVCRLDPEVRTGAPGRVRHRCSVGIPDPGFDRQPVLSLPGPRYTG